MSSMIKSGSESVNSGLSGTGSLDSGVSDSGPSDTGTSDSGLAGGEIVPLTLASAEPKVTCSAEARIVQGVAFEPLAIIAGIHSFVNIPS